MGEEVSASTGGQYDLDFDGSDTDFVNFHAFIVLCLNSGFVPNFVSQAIVMEAYDYLTGGSSVKIIELDMSDLVELVFIISQIRSLEPMNGELKTIYHFSCDLLRVE